MATPEARARRKEDLRMASALARGEAQRALDDIDRHVAGWQSRAEGFVRHAESAWGAARAVLERPVASSGRGPIWRDVAIVVVGAAWIGRWMARSGSGRKRSDASRSTRGATANPASRWWMVVAALAWARRGRRVATVWRMWKVWQRVRPAGARPRGASAAGRAPPRRP